MFRQTLDNFVVGGTNRFAHAAILSVAEGSCQYNPIILCGSCGVGKSHLLKGLRTALRIRGGLDYKNKVHLVSAEAFCNNFLEALRDKSRVKMDKFSGWYRGAECLIVEEITFFQGKTTTAEEFLSVADSLVGQGKLLLCSTNIHPRELKLSQSLVSRLLSGLVIKVEPLNLEMRRGLIERTIKDLGLGKVWNPEVGDYLANNLDGDARPLLGAINAIEAQYRLLGRKIDLTLAQEVLSLQPKELSLEEIERAVEDHFGFCVHGQLRSNSRQKDICHARQMVMYLAKELLPKLSLTDIGKYFDRDHTTVLYACQTIEKMRRDKNGVVEKEVIRICSRLGLK